MAGDNDSFVRWQKIAIDHFGYCTNLILVLAVAALGYTLTFAKDPDFVGAKPRCYLGVLLLVGLFGLCVSIICGLCCMVNRLLDFRGTAQRAKNSPDALSKEVLDRKGDLTWSLFYGQTGAFLVAVLLIAVVVGVALVPRLLHSNSPSESRDWILESYDEQKGYVFRKDGMRYKTHCTRSYLSGTGNLPEATSESECSAVLPYLHKPLPLEQGPRGPDSQILKFTETHEGGTKGWHCEFTIGEAN
jgi:hypothetical protein